MPDTNAPPAAGSISRGTLVAIGGAEDKEDDMVILRRVIEAVRGEAEHVVVIAAASREPVEASRPYLRAFEELGIDHVRPLDLQSRREVEDERTIRRLSEADIIYFTGGDQARLVDVLRGSKALDVIRQRYAQGAVIAGTSAGAAAMGSTMIERGSAEEGLAKGNVRLSEGLGLLPDTLIDTHFIQRGRFGRLLEAVTQHADALGFGICEDTALIVREGRFVEIVGSDNVIVVDGREIAHTSTRQVKEGDPISVERAIVHSLADGYWFDLQTRAFHTPPATKKEVPV